MKILKKIIKENNILFNLYIRFVNIKSIFLHLFVSDAKAIKKKWKKCFHNEINLNNPLTLNEKIQWLKLNCHEELHTILADKYASRKYIADNFGEEYLVPLLFATNRISDLNSGNIKTAPFIIKPNNGSGCYGIYRQLKDVNWRILRRNAATWIKRRYYEESQEWQYKNMKPMIVVEKLLTDKKGKIPNDYKLHFINGKLAFTYCSIDREGSNYRSIYDDAWNLLPFSWSGSDSHSVGPIIERPASFCKMLEIGKYISKSFDYVRVDFFDVDGKLYCGEITLHHGSGYDKFNPPEYDRIYGEKLKITSKI